MVHTTGQVTVVKMAIRQDQYDRLYGMAPADGAITGREWVELALSRFIEDAIEAGLGGPAPVPVDEMAILAARLRTLRRALGWRLRDMADAVGVTIGMVSAMETGRTRVPADLLARVLDTAAGVMGDERLAAVWPGYVASPAPVPASAPVPAAPVKRAKKPLPPELAEEPF